MTLYLIVAATAFAVSASALLLRRHPLVRLMALNLMGIGVFLWLTATARAAAIPDAIPHALVLTGIVVAVSATAFGLALVVRLDGAAKAEKAARDETPGGES